MLGEKAWSELYNNATLFWTNSGRNTPLNSRSQTIQVRTRYAEYCGRKKNDLISYVLQCTSTQEHTSTSRLATYINLVWTVCWLEDLPVTMTDCDEWQARVRGLRDINMTWYTHTHTHIRTHTPTFTPPPHIYIYIPTDSEKFTKDSPNLNIRSILTKEAIFYWFKDH